MSQKLKILYISSEADPLAKTGGLADVSGSLPKEIHQLNADIRIAIPAYGSIDVQRFNPKDLLHTEFEILIGDDLLKGKFKETNLNSNGVIVYLVENDHYYHRNGLYVDPETRLDYTDNAERFIFFAKGILEGLKKLDWKPDIIHCNDWQTGLVSVYLKTLYAEDPFYKDVKTVFTIHNLAYQGIFDKELFPKTGLTWDVFTMDGIEFYDKMNFMKAGIVFSDFITTVSIKYAEEICSSVEFGYGLQGVLSDRCGILQGILNGVDYTVWNPLKDEYIPQKYSGRNLVKKLENKKYLLEKFGLPFNEDIPVIGIISRLADQKGFDLLESATEDLMKLELQIVILGMGDLKSQQFLENLRMEFPAKVGVYIGFSDELAHLIEAGSDMFMMPSRYEPSGLNQMYSLKYGTVPIVRATGGLDDSVEQFNSDTGTGTGFKFIDYKKNDLIAAVKNALSIFREKQLWTSLMKNGMKQDFSWKASAKKYMALYKSLLPNRPVPRTGKKKVV